MIFKAIEFAAKAHSGGYRKGTNLPYIIHPLGVAKILIECGAHENLIVAGILHDTLEDTPVTLDEIEQTFGSDIADLVRVATEPNKDDSWENRKKHTVGMIKTLSEGEAFLVLADKLDNIRAIREDYEKVGESLWGRFNRRRKCQEWYYKSLVVAFKETSADGQSRGLLTHFRSEVLRVFGGTEEVVPCPGRTGCRLISDK